MGDVEALRPLRAASPGLTGYWTGDTAPGEWPGVKHREGRVTYLKLESTPKSPISLGGEGLPAEVGALIELVSLELISLRQLPTLPAEIGQLAKLRELTCKACNDLVSLPAEIGKLPKLETLDMSNCTRLASLPPEIGQLQQLRALKLISCVAIEELPSEIGKLASMKTLRCEGCVRLKALPLEMGTLTGLTNITLEKCNAIELPKAFLSPSVKADEVTGWLAARLLVSEIRVSQPVTSWLHKRPQAVACFLSTIVTEAEYATAVGKAVASCPSLAELCDKSGRKAIELACPACKLEMESNLFFLSRYEVDSGPPLHCSRGSVVLAAYDTEEKRERRILKVMRDENAVLLELKGRVGIDHGVVVPITNVHVCSSAPVEDEAQGIASIESCYDGKVPISRCENLEVLVDGVLNSRCSMGGVPLSECCTGYKYVVVMREADATLASLAPAVASELACVRKTVADIARAVDKVHAQKKSIYGDLQPRHVCLCGGVWQLIDMVMLTRVERPFGRHKVPSSAYCPPEMAKVLLGATDPATGAVNAAKLGGYKNSSTSYDLWSLGCVMHLLVFGAPLWRAAQDGSMADPADLQRLANWSNLDVDALVAKAGEAARVEADPTKSGDRLAAIDLMSKLLDPTDEARKAHFNSSAGNELRAVLKHPFVSADPEALREVAYATAAAATAAAFAAAERRRKDDEEEAASRAETAEQGARLARLEATLETMNAEVESRYAREVQLGGELAQMRRELASVRAVLGPTQKRLSGLEERDEVMQRERTTVLGKLRAQLDADLREAEGMFGGAAKERVTMLHEFVDVYEKTLPIEQSAASAATMSEEAAPVDVSGLPGEHDTPVAAESARLKSGKVSRRTTSFKRKGGKKISSATVGGGSVEEDGSSSSKARRPSGGGPPSARAGQSSSRVGQTSSRAGGQSSQRAGKKGEERKSLKERMSMFQ